MTSTRRGSTDTASPSPHRPKYGASSSDSPPTSCPGGFQVNALFGPEREPHLATDPWPGGGVRQQGVDVVDQGL
jgi:hypothetical protein